MSIRREVLDQLYADIDKHGIVPLSRTGRVKAQTRLEKARHAYEEARREVLRHELARYYRVAIFGSARLEEDSKEFRFVSELARALVEARDVDIVTGGGPGIMKAAHHGAARAIQEASSEGVRLRSRSHGIIIGNLNTNEAPNGFSHYSTRHPEFSTRLQEFIDKTDAAYNAPGGYGTLAEKAILTLTQQVGHLEKDYLIMAHPFWMPVVDAWNDELYHRRVARGRAPLIDETDLKIIRFSDNISEIVGMVEERYDKWATNIRRHVRLTR